MLITACSLNALYWQCLKRTSMDNSTDEELAEGECVVHGITSDTNHIFSIKALERESSKLLCTLKRMDPSVRKSVSEQGIPWIMARSGHPWLAGATINTIEHVVLMCVASGFLSVELRQCDGCVIPYISMNDLALVRREKLKGVRGRSVLRRWFN